MTDGEKLLLAVAAFLILKGLLDPAEKGDRDKIRAAWKNAIDGGEVRQSMPLFDRGP